MEHDLVTVVGIRYLEETCLVVREIQVDQCF